MPPLSISKKKLIRSLAKKKSRLAEKLFLAEGDKLVKELIMHKKSRSETVYEIDSLVATEEWVETNPSWIVPDLEVCQTSLTELEQISLQQTPNQVMAIVHQNEPEFEITEIKHGLSLGLEFIQDPGNLGTIIRMADWFGIRHVLCSKDCVDLYNPKTIQSTMGSFLRVRVHYADLPEAIQDLKEEERFMVYGTSGMGSNLYHTNLHLPGIILLGNEAKGLSPGIIDLTDQVLTIPYHDHTSHPESLNVATAAAILVAEFRRAYSK